MKPKEKGVITEYKVITKLLELGYTVSTVIGDNSPYDIVLDISGNLLRIQIKTGRYRNGCVLFNSCSYRINTKENYITHYTNKADYFIVWCKNINKFYMLKVKSNMPNVINLRVEHPKNNQVKNIRWAKFFNMESVLNSIEKQ